MFTPLVIAALLASSVLIRADPNPNTPGTGAVYNAGTQCPIAWAVDPTGIWKTMNIQLMTGDNLNMIPLTTVATVDATNPSANTFSWTCPEVNPNSAIYFYQFTSPASKNTLWTTRFAIASDSGATTPAPNATQPNGEAIPWGVGALANPSIANPPPSGGSSSGSVTSTVLTTTPSISSVAPIASSSIVGSPSLLAGSTSSSSTPGTTSSASLPSGTAGSSTTPNAAMAALSIDGRIFQAMIAIGVATLGFTIVL